MGQELLKKILTEKFESIKKRNSNYSLRAFSRQLNVSPSAVSEILSGKRRVGKKTLDSIFSKIEFEEETKEALQKTLEKKSTGTHKLLSPDEFKVFTDWHYFAIQSLAETSDFKACPNWIAERLNISSEKAAEAIELLLERKLLIKNKTGQFRSSNIHYTTESPVPSEIIQENHKQNIALALKSIEEIELELRDISSITIALDPKDLVVAKEKIKRFRRGLNRFLESGNKKEVYKLNIQFFPLSKKIGETL